MATVLIVDDDSGSRQVLERLFALRGHRARTVSSGSDALNSLLAGPPAPDVIVLDVMMPDMDGYELLEKIRHDPRLTQVPVVMYSAIGDPSADDRARELGADDFIPKPTPFPEILTRIARLLPQA
ncbi:MAG: PleD family two-component system response regulator [Phycisphaerae bacterium]|nr:response regulator [Tepidisphaeraceae bacterium]